MTGVLQGTVPYPQTANAAPLQRLASDLQQMSQGLQQSSQQIATTIGAAQSTWTGRAADAFAGHANERSRVVRSVAQSIGTTVPVLQTMAAAITTTQAEYNAAVIAEQVARNGLPWTSGALAAAIAAEAAAVGALQGAGMACAGKLAMIELEIAACQFMGVDRETFQAAKDAVIAVWGAAEELFESGEIEAAVEVLNRAQVTVTQPDGTAVRTNAVAWLMNRDPKVSTAFQALQSLVGTYTLLTEPPLDAIERPELSNDFVAAGFATVPTTASELGHNMGLTEWTQRPTGSEPDQSMVVAHTVGTDGRDGSRVLTMTLPGIVEPGAGAINGATGSRNILNAATSQITGFGQQEAALGRWIEAQGIGPGDTVNIYGHSQGGIVGRNVANELAGRGVRVNLVAFGSPDGQLGAGVSAWTYQNVRDAVPLARIGGDADGVTVLHPGQHTIPLRFDVGGVFDNHAAAAYGDAIDAMPSGAHAGNDALDRHLADQARHVHLDGGVRVTTFEGPANTHGEPVDVAPPQEYRIGDRVPIPG
ncbi:MAG: hypothetical protein ACK5OX_05930 [Desertimonas sp.]